MACEEEAYFYRLYLDSRAEQLESPEEIAAQAAETAAFFAAFPMRPVPVRGAAAVEVAGPQRFFCDGPAGE
jgi:hypothetical protein